MPKPLSINEAHNLEGFPDSCVLLAERLNPYDMCRAEAISPRQGARGVHHACGIPVDTEQNCFKILSRFDGTGR
jgi:hypothetical protein